MSYAICSRCQKGYLFPSELHSYGQMAVSKAGISAINTPARCSTCGVCGYTEIYAADAAKLRPNDYPAVPPKREK
ncbi:MAG TPA: hypothetical protein VM536_04855 [Chloroflexia bacterium]|nr:hypothetical protein [Chloroflexia bacterium]